MAKMKVKANNGKVVGSKLAKNGGEVRVRKISNGWVLTESWEEKRERKGSGNKGEVYSDTEYKSEETYLEKNPFA